MGWKKLSSKLLLDHPRVQVIEDRVLLPNKHEIDYLRIERPDASMVIAIGEDGKILLQKEYSYPPNETLYQFPGGAIEKNETPEKAAIRELAEEAKLKGELEYLGWFYVENRRTKAMLHVFLATQLETVDSGQDIEEEFEDFWFSEQEVSDLIHASAIRNYTALAGWAMYKSRK